jgi:putative Holliday junction resolvase
MPPIAAGVRSTTTTTPDSFTAVRIVGLDLGRRRIGLAISDPMGIALPAGTLERRSLQEDLLWLREWTAEREVTRIVVGLPIHMNGSSGPEAEQARGFARKLGEATQLPVDLLDERWTSVEAERALRDSGRPGRTRRKVIDSVAATILLRTYLERESNRRERGET